MSKWKETNLPCPCKKSSDAYSIDVNGDGFCFSCSSYFPNGNGKVNPELSERTLKYIPHRGLTEDSLRFYNILVETSPNDEEVLLSSLIKWPSPNTYQRKSLVSKKYSSTGDMSKTMLFGMDKFPKASQQSITITEGAYDAVAVWQMCSKATAAVSIRSASTALKDCKANWDYINSFDKIIICFDNDDPGNDAANKVAGLFDFNKVFKVNLTKFKDPNDYLMNDAKSDFFKEWLKAKKYTPDEVISTFSEIREALNEQKEKRIGEYPVKSLNDKLKGLHQGEVIVFKGMEGIGKTEIFRLMENHLLKTTSLGIGIIHLEEGPETTITGIASYHLDEAVSLDEGFHTPEQVFEAYTDAVGNDENRVMLYNSFDNDDERTFFDNVRFMVAVGGVKVVFFDHISWLATGGDLNDDERKKLDRISQRLKTMAKELGFCLVMISHVNDDGKTRGSRNITKVANTVINLYRNTVHPDADERNKTYLTVEKARLRGSETGPAGFVIFDPEKTVLQDGTDLKVV